MVSQLNNISAKKREFEPSMRIISRILKILLEKTPVGRTALSQIANVNYVTLIKHLEWLENKSLIESIVSEKRVKIRLNLAQKEFILKLCNLEN